MGNLIRPVIIGFNKLWNNNPQPSIAEVANTNQTVSHHTSHHSSNKLKSHYNNKISVFMLSLETNEIKEISILEEIYNPQHDKNYMIWKQKGKIPAYISKNKDTLEKLKDKILKEEILEQTFGGKSTKLTKFKKSTRSKKLKKYGNH